MEAQADPLDPTTGFVVDHYSRRRGTVREYWERSLWFLTPEVANAAYAEQAEDVAAGLREPGALDHRAAPDVAGPLGDAARGLPLDARPGADRAEDRRSRGAGRAAWLTIDPKLRSSIIEGLSVFLSVFDLPDVAATFCPPKPAREQAGSPADPPTPPCSPAAVARRLPPLDQVIDEGKVLALNMPAGIDRGWGDRPGQNETSTLYRRGGAARQASGGPLRSGTRSGTTPEMSGLDREHAGVSGYGASRVGRSAHVGQEFQEHLVRVAALR